MTLRLCAQCLFILLASSAPISAQQWAADMFQVKNYDFGTVSRGVKAEYEFEIYNPYVEDVHISNIYASCSCTSVSSEKRTLKTYETTKILAHYNTDKFFGPKSATITVVLDKPFPATVQLHVKGYIRSDVVFQPGSVEFGAVYPGETLEKSIDLSYRGRSNWQITGVKTSDPNISVDVKERQRSNGNVGYQLHVKLSPDMPIGYINERITLLTNDGTSQGIQLMVQGLVKSNIMVSPASLMLGSLESGQETVKQIVIRGDKPFKISNITCGNDSFTFDLPVVEEREAKMVHIIPVRFKADSSVSMQANIAETIKIETDASQKSTELPVYVEVSPSTSSDETDAAKINEG